LPVMGGKVGGMAKVRKAAAESGVSRSDEAPSPVDQALRSETVRAWRAAVLAGHFESRAATVAQQLRRRAKEEYRVAKLKDPTFDPGAYAVLEPKKSETAELLVNAMLQAARVSEDQLQAAADMAGAGPGAAS